MGGGGCIAERRSRKEKERKERFVRTKTLANAEEFNMDILIHRNGRIA